MRLLNDFRIVRPTTAAAAVQALAEAGAKPLAGGTDLLPNLRRRLDEPTALVDLTAVPGLDAIAETDAGLTIGAAATVEAIAEHPAIRAGWPALAEAALAVAGPTHRAAATLGGNLCQDTRCVFYNQSEWWREGNGWCLKLKGDVCHVVKKSDRCYAVFAGDIAPALIVLEAEAVVTGPSGARRLPLAQLYREEGRTHLTLAPGEVVTGVIVPRSTSTSGYAKVRVRDAVDFPLAGVAIALRREGDKLAEFRVALTGVASAPVVVGGLDDLIGQTWSADAAKLLAETVRKACNTVKTTITTPKYRRRVASAAAVRLAEDLWTGTAR